MDPEGFWADFGVFRRRSETRTRAKHPITGKLHRAQSPFACYRVLWVWFRLGGQKWFGGAGTTAKGEQGILDRSPR